MGTVICMTTVTESCYSNFRVTQSGYYPTRISRLETHLKCMMYVLGMYQCSFGEPFPSTTSTTNTIHLSNNLLSHEVTHITVHCLMV